MRTARLEAFTDGVVAIIITITVLELKVPHIATLAGLRAAAPLLAAYALSFVNVGLFWANHHHLLHAAERVDGRALWANHFMLFWLSLVPWIIGWLDESGFAALPAALYGLVLGLAGLGYNALQRALIRVNGRDGALGRAVARDRKGKLSIAAYAAAVPLAFVSPWLSLAIYLLVAGIWLVPDRRIERGLAAG